MIKHTLSSYWYMSWDCCQNNFLHRNYIILDFHWHRGNIFGNHSASDRIDILETQGQRLVDHLDIWSLDIRVHHNLLPHRANHSGKFHCWKRVLLGIQILEGILRNLCYKIYSANLNFKLEDLQGAIYLQNKILKNYFFFVKIFFLKISSN